MALYRNSCREHQSRCAGEYRAGEELKGNLLHGEEREVSTPNYGLMEAITASAVLMKR